MTDFLLRLEGLIPTIGSFFATLLLFITYYGKQRFDSMKNKLFSLFGFGKES